MVGIKRGNAAFVPLGFTRVSANRSGPVYTGVVYGCKGFVGTATMSPDGAVVQETVRATVEAYAAGEIKLDPVEDKTNKSLIRYAPSFSAGIRVDPFDPRP